MDGLVDDGLIILGRPVGEGNPPEETLHAVEAADDDETRTRLARDPAASHCIDGCLKPLSLGLSLAPATVPWLE